MVPPIDPTKVVPGIAGTGAVSPGALPVVPALPAAVDPTGLARLVGDPADPLRHPLLTAQASDVSEQLDGLGRNWSPAGRSLVAAMREEFRDPARHALLLSMLPGRAVRSRFLAGLIVMEEDPGKTFAETLSGWTKLLFPSLPADLDVTAYERRYHQLRGHLKELERVERFLFEQMGDLDEMALEKGAGINEGRSDDEILDRVAFRLALEDAGFELTRAVPEGPAVRIREVGAARHNAAQQMVCLITYLDNPQFLRQDSAFHRMAGGRTLNAQWRMALHGFAFCDQAEKRGGGTRSWLGHVPDVVIRRYKRGKVPEGARIQVKVVLEGDLDQLVFCAGEHGGPPIAGRIHQILRNLVSNGIKYCNLAEPNPEITINIRALDHGAFIICHDNGLGGARLGERGHENEAPGQGIGLDWVKQTVTGFFRSDQGIEPFTLITSDRVAPGGTGGNTTILIILPSEIFE